MTSHTINHPIHNLMLSNSIRAAVVGFAKTQSFELAPHGILVNSVGPGVTDTDRIKQLFTNQVKRNQTTLEQEYALAVKIFPWKGSVSQRNLRTSTCFSRRKALRS